MARPENIAINRHITAEELLKRIKSLEKDTKVLQRLYFIKYRYEASCSYITLIIAHVKKYYNDKVLLTPSYDYAA